MTNNEFIPFEEFAAAFPKKSNKNPAGRLVAIKTISDQLYMMLVSLAKKQDELSSTDDENYFARSQLFALIGSNLQKALQIYGALIPKDKATSSHSSSSDFFESDDGDSAFDRCVDRQQEINQTAIDNLGSADNLPDKWETIKQWGNDTADNLDKCIRGE